MRLMNGRSMRGAEIPGGLSCISGGSYEVGILHRARELLESDPIHLAVADSRPCVFAIRK